MSKQELQQSLESLRVEVDALGADKAASKGRLLAVVGDLEHQIENLDDVGHRGSMLERLPALIKHFEAEHPSITAALNRIVTTLSDMGI